MSGETVLDIIERNRSKTFLFERCVVRVCEYWPFADVGGVKILLIDRLYRF